MTGGKDKKDPPETINHVPEDNLNAKIGVLTRREVEARILAPMLDAMRGSLWTGKGVGGDA